MSVPMELPSAAGAREPSLMTRQAPHWLVVEEEAAVDVELAERKSLKAEEVQRMAAAVEERLGLVLKRSEVVVVEEEHGAWALHLTAAAADEVQRRGKVPLMMAFATSAKAEVSFLSAEEAVLILQVV